MLVLSWNVAGRADRLPAQLAAVCGRAPDLVALQEISAATYPAWREGLLRAGYSVISAAELAELPYPPPPYRYPEIKQTQIHRKNFNLTAARHPIAALPGLRFDVDEEARLAFPEKFVAAEMSLAGQLVEIHNAHAPPGSTRYLLKPQALAAVARRLDVRSELPQILCGDFNTPQSEGVDKPVVTWAGLYPEVEGEWDAAERGILEHPRLRDAYRQVHQPGDPWPYSHQVRRRDELIPRRYDHVFVSGHFTVRACCYLTEWLDDGLSDHAAVEADLALGDDEEATAYAAVERRAPAPPAPSGPAGELHALVAHIERTLGDPATWDPAPGYASTALCVLDSVWSIGVRYQGVLNVLDRYRALRAAHGADAEHDTPAELAAEIAELGGPEAFAEAVSNRQRTSARGGILKAEAVLRQAQMLAEEGIAHPRDLLSAEPETLETVRERWTSIPGQGSGLSLDYFLMLNGLPGVKADRMIRRFVAAALGQANELSVSADDAGALVRAAAAGELEVSDRLLDYAIWRHESSR